MKKIVFLYASLITVMVVLWYIFYPTTAPSSPWGTIKTGISGEIDEKYVMVTYDSGQDYWKNAFKGFEDAAKALNVSVDYVGASQFDANEQVTILEQVIAKKPKGIAIAGIQSPELSDALDKASDAGIPIVAIDTKIDSDKVASFLGTDNYNAGVLAAKRMMQEVGTFGNVGIITDSQKPNEQLRVKGFVDTMASQFPTRNITRIADGKGDRLTARKMAREMIASDSVLNGIFATDTEAGIGVAEAAEFFNKKSIKIISFDSDIRTLDKISKGIITTSIVQGTWNMGYWSLVDLFHLQHELLNVTEHEERNIPLLPDEVYTGVTFITKDNVNNFYVK
jgi:ribose transport system substrate-binding protein